MSATITKNFRVNSAISFIENNFVLDNSSYFYIGRPIEWDDENSPDIVSSTYYNEMETKKTRIFMKKILSDDAITAIRRYNWIINTTYTRADSTVEYNDISTWETTESPFYIINSEGYIYKCISNANGSPSTIEPTGTSTTYLNLGDGYIWKFMFDLSSEIETKFLTDMWIPVPYDATQKSSNQLLVEGSSVYGDIPYIHVDDSGSDYTTPPNIEIVGDGTGALAVPIMSSGGIESITITNAGAGYTYANINIVGNGVDAVCTAMVSPEYGHGSDALRELSASNVEVAVELVGDEGGDLPTTGSYRNIGIVQDTLDLSSELIDTSTTNMLSTFDLTNSTGTFTVNEIILGQVSRAKCNLYYDPSGTDKQISVYNIEGVFFDGEDIYGQTSNITSEYNSATSIINNNDKDSGNILYQENIRFITRREIQTEKFTFTIEF